MLSQVSIKSVAPSSTGKLMLADRLGFSVPPFDGAEFREARIFSEPGECVKMELLFICRTLPADIDKYRKYCLYCDLKTGVIGSDCSLPTWNGTYSAEVGSHWVTVLCYLSEISLLAVSGGWHDMVCPREARGRFQDYHQEVSRQIDDLASCAQA